MSAEEKIAYNEKLGALRKQKSQKQAEINKKMTAEEKKSDDEKLNRFINMTEAEREAAAKDPKKFAAEAQAAGAAEAAGVAGAALDVREKTYQEELEDLAKSTTANKAEVEWAQQKLSRSQVSPELKAIPEAGQLTQEQKSELKVAPKAEQVVPVKITDETARPKEERDETAIKVGEVRGDLNKLLNSKDVPDIVKLLKEYLPMLGQNEGPGLTSATNRWAV
jgi:hypothetical protein